MTRADLAAEAKDWLEYHAAALTDAQLRVARLLADGLTQAEAADRLGVQAHAVRYHVYGIRIRVATAERRVGPDG